MMPWATASTASGCDRRGGTGRRRHGAHRGRCAHRQRNPSDNGHRRLLGLQRADPAEEVVAIDVAALQVARPAVRVELGAAVEDPVVVEAHHVARLQADTDLEATRPHDADEGPHRPVGVERPVGRDVERCQQSVAAPHLMERSARVEADHRPAVRQIGVGAIAVAPQQRRGREQLVRGRVGPRQLGGAGEAVDEDRVTASRLEDEAVEELHTRHRLATDEVDVRRQAMGGVRQAVGVGLRHHVPQQAEVAVAAEGDPLGDRRDRARDGRRVANEAHPEPADLVKPAQQAVVRSDDRVVLDLGRRHRRPVRPQLAVVAGRARPVVVGVLGQPAGVERRAVGVAGPHDQQVSVGRHVDARRGDVLGDRLCVDESLGHGRMPAGRTRAVVAEPEMMERRGRSVVPGQHYMIVRPGDVGDGPPGRRRCLSLQRHRRPSTAACRASRTRRARPSSSSGRISETMTEKPVRSDGQAPCDEPPAPVCPKASGGGPSADGIRRDLEPDAEPQRPAGQRVVARRELTAADVDRVGFEEAHVADLPTRGEAAVQLCHRPGRGDAVRPGHFDGEQGRILPVERHRRVGVDEPQPWVRFAVTEERREGEVRRPAELSRPRGACRRCADREIEAERTGDLVGDERADAAAVDAADERVAQPAVRERVVRRRPHRDDRLLGGEQVVDLLRRRRGPPPTAGRPHRADRRCGRRRRRHERPPCRWRRTPASSEPPGTAGRAARARRASASPRRRRPWTPTPRRTPCRADHGRPSSEAVPRQMSTTRLPVDNSRHRRARSIVVDAVA